MDLPPPLTGRGPSAFAGEARCGEGAVRVCRGGSVRRERLEARVEPAA